MEVEWIGHSTVPYGIRFYKKTGKDSAIRKSFQKMRMIKTSYQIRSDYFIKQILSKLYRKKNEKPKTNIYLSSHFSFTFL